MKVALAHDYLREYGGAERVLEALHQMFPDAPVFVAFVDKKAMGIHWQKFADWDIRETWMASIPLIKRSFSPLRFLAPKAFQDLDLSEYDLVISSSNAYQAKAVAAPNGVHICYCHTPPRSLYGYSTRTNWKQNHAFKLVGGLINHYMRVADYTAAQKVDHFIANSVETQKRIEKFYRRKSTVIFPPVSIAKTIADTSKNQDYYLYVNRLALAKHPEIAVAAATQLDLPLKVVGSGVMLEELKKLAGESISFEGAVSDDRLRELYSGAKALLYPVEDEDFGMVPVEAMGHGVPVIAYQSGGPKETIINGKTGLFFEELSVERLVEAIGQFQSLDKKNSFNSVEIHRHAQRFSPKSFEKKLHSFIKKFIEPTLQAESVLL